jgi:hypothetical protein
LVFTGCSNTIALKLLPFLFYYIPRLIGAPSTVFNATSSFLQFLLLRYGLYFFWVCL